MESLVGQGRGRAASRTPVPAPEAIETPPSHAATAASTIDRGRPGRKHQSSALAVQEQWIRLEQKRVAFEADSSVRTAELESRESALAEREWASVNREDRVEQRERRLASVEANLAQRERILKEREGALAFGEGATLPVLTDMQNREWTLREQSAKLAARRQQLQVDRAFLLAAQEQAKEEAASLSKERSRLTALAEDLNTQKWILGEQARRARTGTGEPHNSG